MPTPEIRKAMPGKQSVEKRLRATILNSDLVRPFGPVGASARVTHGLAKPDAPLGHQPRTDEWNENPMVHGADVIRATRPPSDRRRSDLVR